MSILALHCGTALADGGRRAVLRRSSPAKRSWRSDCRQTTFRLKKLDDCPVGRRGQRHVTERGIVVVGPRSGDTERLAYAVALDAPGVSVEAIQTAALAGVVCADT